MPGRPEGLQLRTCSLLLGRLHFALPSSNLGRVLPVVAVGVLREARVHVPALDLDFQVLGRRRLQRFLRRSEAGLPLRLQLGERAALTRVGLACIPVVCQVLAAGPLRIREERDFDVVRAALSHELEITRRLVRPERHVAEQVLDGPLVDDAGLFELLAIRRSPMRTTSPPRIPSSTSVSMITSPPVISRRRCSTARLSSPERGTALVTVACEMPLASSINSWNASAMSGPSDVRPRRKSRRARFSTSGSAPARARSTSRSFSAVGTRVLSSSVFACSSPKSAPLADRPADHASSLPSSRASRYAA